jgi:hypothetical protein
MISLIRFRFKDGVTSLKLAKSSIIGKALIKTPRANYLTKILTVPFSSLIIEAADTKRFGIKSIRKLKLVRN